MQENNENVRNRKFNLGHIKCFYFQNINFERAEMNWIEIHWAQIHRFYADAPSRNPNFGTIKVIIQYGTFDGHVEINKKRPN